MFMCVYLRVSFSLDSKHIRIYIFDVMQNPVTMWFIFISVQKAHISANLSVKQEGATWLAVTIKHAIIPSAIQSSFAAGTVLQVCTGDAWASEIARFDPIPKSHYINRSLRQRLRYPKIRLAGQRGKQKFGRRGLPGNLKGPSEA